MGTDPDLDLKSQQIRTFLRIWNWICVLVYFTPIQIQIQWQIQIQILNEMIKIPIHICDLDQYFFCHDRL